MNTDFIFQNGDTVKDETTGFQGIVVSCSSFLSGCNRYGLQPKVKKDGSMPEAQWFDEPRLKLVKRAIKQVDTRAVRTGADIRDPRV